MELESTANEASILAERLRTVGDEKRKLRTALDSAVYDYEELLRSTADLKAKASKSDMEI